jgi:hypothetical protein
MNKRLPFIKLTNGKYTYSKINKKVDKNGEYYKKLKIDSNATYQ